MQVCIGLGNINFVLAQFHSHTLHDNSKLDFGEEKFFLCETSMQVGYFIFLPDVSMRASHDLSQTMTRQACAPLLINQVCFRIMLWCFGNFSLYKFELERSSSIITSQSSLLGSNY